MNSIKEYLSYRVISGLAGEKQIDSVIEKLRKAEIILQACKYFEHKTADKIEQAQDYSMFPQLANKYKHQADISKRAAMRMRKIFNTLINEIQL